ncbi:MAG TPA: peptidoglycan editing factor PgeF [Burkholderiales bacterium]|nr:peptidoglycan editing factor PgeF [Burkholderiales bacterium]
MSAAQPHPDWIVPDWPAAPHVKALITTRAGGVSEGPHESLNVGFSTADTSAAVEANRARLRRLLPQDPRWLKQVHGARVVEADTVLDRPEADASIARNPGTVSAIQVADCLPILFTNRAGSVVAAAHAGWRGLAAGVIDSTVAAMGGDPREMLAYVGPGIGPLYFEVGDEVREAYVSRDAGAAPAFTRKEPAKWLADLPALARRALRRCGITDIYGCDLCTYSNPARFYSYRRDGETGRMAALIWREGPAAL